MSISEIVTTKGDADRDRSIVRLNGIEYRLITLVDSWWLTRIIGTTRPVNVRSIMVNGRRRYRTSDVVAYAERINHTICLPVIRIDEPYKVITADDGAEYVICSEDANFYD